MKDFKTVALVGVSLSIGFVAGSAVVGRSVLKNEAARRVIVDNLAKKINDALYGPVENRTPRSHVSYRTYYSPRHRAISRDCFVFDSREEAENVLSQANQLAKSYGHVTIGDLCDLTGSNSVYTDNKYGWTNLDNAQIEQFCNNQWLLKLPNALPIN